MEEIHREIKEYLRENWGIYSFITVLFILGVLIGALAVRGLEESQRFALNHYFSLFLDSFTETGEWDQEAVFRQSLRLNFQYLFLTWFCGIFIFGYPLIAGLTVLRGFSVGFTVGFLVERASFRGILFAMGSVLPHNLLIIPAFIVVTVTGFSFSWLRFCGRLEKRPASIREHIGPYTMMTFLIGLVLFIGILIEAYISPVFVRLLIPLMTGS
ncbi:MAG: stage II sporulation protein M [Bacillota bacterium]